MTSRDLSFGRTTSLFISKNHGLSMDRSSAEFRMAQINGGLFPVGEVKLRIMVSYSLRDSSQVLEYD